MKYVLHARARTHTHTNTLRHTDFRWYAPTHARTHTHSHALARTHARSRAWLRTHTHIDIKRGDVVARLRVFFVLSFICIYLFNYFFFTFFYSGGGGIQRVRHEQGRQSFVARVAGDHVPWRRTGFLIELKRDCFVASVPWSRTEFIMNFLF